MHINLVIIPYTVQLKDICQFLALQLDELKYDYDKERIDTFNPQVTTDRMIITTERILALINRLNGKLLSGICYNTKSTIEVQCANEHIWKPQICSILRGHWCYICKTVRTTEWKNKITKKKVNQLDLITERAINTFDSIADAYRFLGKNHSDGSVSNVCQGKRNSAYGFKWSYA